MAIAKIFETLARPDKIICIIDEKVYSFVLLVYESSTLPNKTNNRQITVVII